MTRLCLRSRGTNSACSVSLRFAQFQFFPCNNFQLSRFGNQRECTVGIRGCFVRQNKCSKAIDKILNDSITSKSPEKREIDRLKGLSGSKHFYVVCSKITVWDLCCSSPYIVGILPIAQTSDQPNSSLSSG